nr:immunoglobulin heavy chain junction region [Mus musculus]
CARGSYYSDYFDYW